MELGQGLDALNAALAERPGSAAVDFLHTATGWVHLEAALGAADACTVLARREVLDRSNGFCLARSCLQLALCAGRRGLAAATAHATAGRANAFERSQLEDLTQRIPYFVVRSTAFIGVSPPRANKKKYLATLCSTAVDQLTAVEFLDTAARALLILHPVSGAGLPPLPCCCCCCCLVRFV